ncbi:MAG: helix-turn-helix transcriptional regulator [Bacteroidetes bacterium]|nr:helix-turn-helix transcriptional regulator [Bacteroidota bacterium]
MKQSNRDETVVGGHAVTDKKKMEKIFARIDLENPPPICPIRDVLAKALDKWSMLIILMLGYNDTLRFGDLKKKIKGISPKMLSISLKHLEQDGFLVRTVFPEVPLRVEYHLTDQGKSFCNKILDLSEWINDHFPEIVKRRYKVDEIM